MINKDDLVQQLLELDAEIAAAEERRQRERSEALRWSDNDLAYDDGGSRAIQRLRERRERFARQIEELPDPEVE